jgi:PAS domain S-box-containing protein
LIECWRGTINNKDNRPEQAAELRRKAEEIARRRAVPSPKHVAALSPEEKMVHELLVHRIELEMQNEELRRTQAELDAARERYVDLYDLAPVGYCTLSEQGLILEANLTAATLLGVNRSALVNRPFPRFILPEDQDVYYLHRKHLFETGEPQACDLRMVQGDATAFWAHLEATVAQDATAGPVCRVAISDVTDRVRVEKEKAELEARNRRLQKAESLSRMAGAIAHNFNNQLQAVLMNLELARGDLLQDAGPAARVTGAMIAARQAAEMSELMLTYVGQAHAVRESMDLSIACSRWLSLLRVALPKHVVLEIDLAFPGPTIRANAEQVQQVLTHLVTNAWEADGAGRAEIQVTVKAVTAAEVPLAHRVPPDWQPQGPAFACLEVVDYGPGIAEADIEKIFDPFFSSKFTGRGMGLAVVLGIVRAHGGAVTVESTPGSRSAFRVYLPVSEGGVRAGK